MSDRFTIERVKNNQIDTALLALVVLLIGVGLAVLFTSSYYYGERVFKDAYYFIKRQVVFVIIGTILALIASRISLDLVRKFIPVFLIISFGLLLLTFTPLGGELLGARRWIFIFNNSFQPSEVVKFSMILYLAHILSKKEERVNDLVNTVFPVLIVSALFIGIIYLQNDFSTAFFIFFLSLIMFYIAKLKLRYFFMFGLGITPLLLILVFSKVHILTRVLNFIDPTIDPQGGSYQIKAATSALLNGGLWGKGLGQSLKKHGGLPDAHSDFIFAVVGEEIGFIGILFVITLFVVFAVRGYMIAFAQKDRFQFYLAFAITTNILYQALLNIAVVGNLVPVTGMPLPFFSSGGSLILMLLTMCGLLMNVSQSGVKNES
jgi:cell division protein FtsW